VKATGYEVLLTHSGAHLAIIGREPRNPPYLRVEDGHEDYLGSIEDAELKEFTRALVARLWPGAKIVILDRGT